MKPIEEPRMQKPEHRDHHEYDLFNDMFSEQMFFQHQIASVFPDRPNILDLRNIEDKETMFKETFILLVKELTEVLDEINFKPHAKRDKEPNKEKILEELIDAFKYWMNLCIIFEFEPGDIYYKFYEKSKIVRQRLGEVARNAES